MLLKKFAVMEKPCIESAIEYDVSSRQAKRCMVRSERESTGDLFKRLITIESDVVLYTNY